MVCRLTGLRFLQLGTAVVDMKTGALSGYLIANIQNYNSLLFFIGSIIYVILSMALLVIK